MKFSKTSSWRVETPERAVNVLATSIEGAIWLAQEVLLNTKKGYSADNIVKVTHTTDVYIEIQE